LSPSIFSAERTPAADAAERPIRERQMAAYHKAGTYTEGCDVLEIGCGEGIGTSILAEAAASVTAVDYSEAALRVARKRYATDNITFTHMSVPPLEFDDSSFDVVVCFQMIEHIEKPDTLVREIGRVLRANARALFATVNKNETISDNPYHLHEFTAEEFRGLLENYFDVVELYGVFGDELFSHYWQSNRNWVHAFMRLDILNLSPRLPRRVRQKLFAVASRLMRVSLKRSAPELCETISHENFDFCRDELVNCLDFFAVCQKMKP
jgi:ubiquinone/menaquinone biosynthesis C-methylase UbiE